MAGGAFYQEEGRDNMVDGKKIEIRQTKADVQSLRKLDTFEEDK
jgi:hypothetical protein